MIENWQSVAFKKAQALMNYYGAMQIPFVFVIDYKLEQPLVWKVEEIDASKVKYNFRGFTNECSDSKPLPVSIEFERKSTDFERYQEGFNHVVASIRKGDSFLVNYTQPTQISTNLTLDQIYQAADAWYKLWLRDKLVCFSPEIFVTVKDGKIASFPMKGTIKADFPQAGEQLLNDKKEQAEHATIVDLIRNDISQLCDKVWVERYRYLDRIETQTHALYQASSEIVGQLQEAKQRAYGDILAALLPAGSICGAPKSKTLEIIEEAEQYERGYYTGVMGYSDGQNFESAVMIRYIEQDQEGNFWFKSGGGITSQSTVHAEYEELIEKVYLPIITLA